MSTPYSLAISFVLLDGDTQNPRIKAFEAWARTTSLSVIVPIPLLITLTLTPSTSIFSRAFLTASSEPFTSAFNTTLISFVSESIDANKLSNVNEVFWNYGSRYGKIILSMIKNYENLIRSFFKNFQKFLTKFSRKLLQKMLIIVMI